MRGRIFVYLYSENSDTNVVKKIRASFDGRAKKIIGSLNFVAAFCIARETLVRQKPKKLFLLVFLFFYPSRTKFDVLHIHPSARVFSCACPFVCVCERREVSG